jgi:hypothetical protein
MLSQEQGKNAKQTEVKQRHPGFVVSNDTSVTPGRTARPQEVIISPAVKQLNKDGYIVYNTPEKQDIYISIQPDTAFFDDEGPEMVKMAGGSFVSGNKHAASVEVQVKPEPETRLVKYEQPADIFANAARRDSFGEIDFNEIIIKKNESFETEIEQPVYYKPAFEEKYTPVLEESFKTRSKPMVAATSTGVEVMDITMRSARFTEEPMYDVEILPTERMMVSDVPKGLYVDGYKPSNIASLETSEKSEHASFVGTSVKAETAETSEAMPMTERIMDKTPVTDTANAAARMEMKDIFETAVEAVSETVSDIPASVDIADPVADLMKMTIPSLRMSEDLIRELSQGMERTIPDDGMESYDCRFEPMVLRAKGKVQAAASFGSEGRESAIDPDPPVDFIF